MKTLENEVLKLHQKLHRKIGLVFAIIFIVAMLFKTTSDFAVSHYKLGVEMKEAVLCILNGIYLMTASVSFLSFFFFFFTIPDDDDEEEDNDNGNIS